MHSFLVTGNNDHDISESLDELVKKHKVRALEFEVAKIGDVRKLNDFTKLKVDSPTAIIAKGIDTATHEAANALLKNIEEPQDGLFYFLTARRLSKVLPTIISRCQIVRAKNSKAKVVDNVSKKFDQMTPGAKLNHISSIKDREGAIEFVENMILYYNSQLVNSNFLSVTAGNLKASDQARSNLLTNGNVRLQLTNLIVNLV